jgi:hypothetical protein
MVSRRQKGSTNRKRDQAAVQSLFLCCKHPQECSAPGRHLTGGARGRCPVCQAIREIGLKEQQERCPVCGLTMDRDLNAALNLEQLFMQETTASSAGSNACGEQCAMKHTIVSLLQPRRTRKQVLGPTVHPERKFQARFAGGGYQSARNGNSLAAYPTIRSGFRQCLWKEEPNINLSWIDLSLGER